MCVTENHIHYNIMCRRPIPLNDIGTYSYTLVPVVPIHI